MIKDTLHNRAMFVTISNISSLNNDSYKTDKFGKSITFHRTTKKTGVTTMELQNDKGQIVYNGTAAIEESDRILDSFNIAINNPLTILHQEEAKQFSMRDNLDASLFEFVMTSTCVKNILDEYKAASMQLNLAKDMLKDKERIAHEEEVELEKCSKMYNDLLKFYESESLETKEHQQIVKWGHDKACKEKYETLNAKVAKFEEIRNGLKQKREEYKSFKQSIDKKLENLQLTSSQIQDQLIRKDQNLAKLKSELSELLDDKKSHEGKKKDLLLQINESTLKVNELSVKINKVYNGNGLYMEDEEQSKHEQALYLKTYEKKKKNPLEMS